MELGIRIFPSRLVLSLGLRVHLAHLAGGGEDVVEKQKPWLVALDEREFHPNLLQIQFGRGQCECNHFVTKV